MTITLSVLQLRDSSGATGRIGLLSAGPFVLNYFIEICTEEWGKLASIFRKCITVIPCCIVARCYRSDTGCARKFNDNLTL